MAKTPRSPRDEPDASLSVRMLRHPILSRDEENALLRKAASGDVDARDTLVVSNLRFVTSVARRYGPASGIEPDDAFQEGVIGELKAIGKFDVKTGNRLSTYASWWVRQSIQRSGQETARTIRLPAPMLGLVRTLTRARDAIEAAGERATDEALMAATGFDPERLRTVAEVAALVTVSLDAPVSEDGVTTLADFCGDVSAGPEPFHDHVERQERHLELGQALDRLTEIERAVLEARYDGDLTLEATAAKIAPLCTDGRVLSRERIRQIQADAIKKLRETMTSAGPF